MLTLGNLFLLLILATIGAWLWHAHGLREHALLLVTRHCARIEVELLDGNVAFRRFALVRDARGNRRLARIFDFEFTVTGEQRLTGNITLFGRQAGRIVLDPHPFPPQHQTAAELPQPGNVINLSDWRSDRQRPGE